MFDTNALRQLALVDYSSSPVIQVPITPQDLFTVPVVDYNEFTLDSETLAQMAIDDDMVTMNELGSNFIAYANSSYLPYTQVLQTEHEWWQMESAPEDFEEEEGLVMLPATVLMATPVGIDVWAMIKIKLGAILGLSKAEWDLIADVIKTGPGKWLGKIGQNRSWKWIKFCIERFLKALFSKAFYNRLVQEVGEALAKKLIAKMAAKFAGILGLALLILDIAKSIGDQLEELEDNGLDVNAELEDIYVAP